VLLLTRFPPTTVEPLAAAHTPAGRPVLPKPFEAIRRECCVPRRILDIAAAEVRLQGPGIDAIAGQETGEPVEFDGMNEQELSEYISKMMVELGIEIVREEESELSVLSST
jgi:hypothetical protein